MAVADLAAEFFETDLLRAAIAARGIFGTSLGPWSAGTSLVRSVTRRHFIDGRRVTLRLLDIAKRAAKMICLPGKERRPQPGTGAEAIDVSD